MESVLCLSAVLWHLGNVLLSWGDLNLRFDMMTQVTDILVKLLWWFLGSSSVIGYLVRVSEALNCLALASVWSHIMKFLELVQLLGSVGL